MNALPYACGMLPVKLRGVGPTHAARPLKDRYRCSALRARAPTARLTNGWVGGRLSDPFAALSEQQRSSCRGEERKERRFTPSIHGNVH